MDNVRRIGIRAVPDDADVAKFLGKLQEEYAEKAAEVEEQLTDTIEETIRENQPPIFAFGKLLNYLATLEKPELVELFAGLIWKDKW
jgi:hypothetical protein